MISSGIFLLCNYVYLGTELSFQWKVEETAYRGVRQTYQRCLVGKKSKILPRYISSEQDIRSMMTNGIAWFTLEI
jgi:hypothetical protein